MLKIFVKNKTFKMGLHFGKSRRIIMLTKHSKQFELQKTQLQNENEFTLCLINYKIVVYALQVLTVDNTNIQR